jgi:tetratricopeptide (TPR) repeat protein
MKHSLGTLALIAILLPNPSYAQAGPPTTADAAQALESSGKRGEALEAYRQILKENPSSFDAEIGIGRVLDLDGKYAEARQHLQKAVELASDDDKNAALATLAQSYVFEGKASDAAKYYEQAFNRQISAGALDAAAGTANAIGRVYLETGDVANAEKWYRTGYDTIRKMKTQTPEQTDLWEMRWEHAQARIAARRKQFDVAHQHLETVRTIVGRGRLADNQQAQSPYLAGYVAFYEGKPDDAIAELAKASQEDPFVLSLLAQAYEQKKDQEKARSLYTRILAMPDHSLQAAFARPLAQRRVK